MAQDDGGSKKKLAIIGVCSLLLVAMVVAVTIGVNKSGDDEVNESDVQETATSGKAIRSICEPTDYKKTCEDSLSKANPNNTTDPQALIKLGFQVTIGELRKAVNRSQTVNAAAQDPMSKQAVADCRELMDLAIDDLQNSFAEMGDFDFSKLTDYLDNLKTWLSGSITYQQTCLDGFTNSTSEAGHKMQNIMKTSQQLTSNALAMVSQLSSIIVDLNIPGITDGGRGGGGGGGGGGEGGGRGGKSPDIVAKRRLLGHGDGFPKWVDARRRHLMAVAVKDLKPNVVVAEDGSGKYKTINRALEAMPTAGNKTYVIHVKAGVYKEQVSFTRIMNNVVLVGDGPEKTKITGSLNFKAGTNTFKTATVCVVADGFIARDIGFENSAGAEGHQAVAFRASGDMAIFHNCRFDGYQDTLYAHAHRQFYRDCTITGTIDFIFGDASAVFQNCKILIRKPLPNQACIVTAQGRTEWREVTGIVLQNCSISGEPDYIAVKAKNKGYLGRPWKEFSRTVVMQSHIDDVIVPEGWLPWEKEFALNTLWYAEYRNRGAGAKKTHRVKWRGLQKKITDAQALSFTPGAFINGDSWIMPTGVPYEPGMMEL